jgi:hypothetical protein
VLARATDGSEAEANVEVPGSADLVLGSGRRARARR